MKELNVQDCELVSGGYGYAMGAVTGAAIYAGAAISSQDASVGGLVRASIRGAFIGQIIKDNVANENIFEKSAGNAALMGLGLGLVGGLF